ncbi:MAG: VanW family protein [Oscillospiraceae bacterium]|jgi:vancomycin resistance protein YoaR|nr:VanW family protein [Oscillospiraceae bacterium]
MTANRPNKHGVYDSDLAFNSEAAERIAREPRAVAATARIRRKTDDMISRYGQTMKSAKPPRQICEFGGDPSVDTADASIPMEETQPNARVRPVKQARRGGRWSAPVTLISLAIIAAVFFWANGQIAAYDEYQTMRATVARSTFYDGITVDGINLGGMTMEQAESLFTERDAQENASFYVDLFAGANNWRISSEQVELHRNTETTLRQAYAIGRTGSLEERYRAVSALSDNSVAFNTSMWYDKTTVRNLVESVAASMTVESRDAGVAGFDFKTRQFTFIDEQAGQRVDSDALLSNVIAALDRKSADSKAVLSPIEVNVIHVAPSVTREQVPYMYGKVASFTTTTTSNANRNTNIQLSTAAINGSVLQPDEIISFNEKTGQRTPAKGYKEAGAIKNGALVEEPGGGVCQVSTTLFNALVRSDLSIVTRNPHAWPVDYVHRGEDAMVNWPDQDMKMKNTTGSPIYIIGSFSNRTLTFEVYGLTLGEGKVIDLESVTTKTTQPGEPVYTRNTGLAAGTSVTKINARTGYEVTTYKVIYQNGKEVSRDVFYRSAYRPYTKQVEYN